MFGSGVGCVVAAIVLFTAAEWCDVTGSGRHVGLVVVRPVYGTNRGVDWSSGGRPAAARAAFRRVCARSSILLLLVPCGIAGDADDDDAAAAAFEEEEEEERSISPIVLLMGVVSEATRGSDGEHDGRVRLLLLLLLLRLVVPVWVGDVRASS